MRDGTIRIILITAAALGVLADALLRETPWGLNLSIWVLAIAAATLLITKRGTDRKVVPVWQLGLIAGLALLFAVRDTATLKALSVLALSAAFGATALMQPVARLRLVTLLDVTLASSAAAIHTACGAAPLLRGTLPWERWNRGQLSRRAPAAVRGMAVSVPLLLVFGGLFASADAAFAGLAARLVHVDLGPVTGHALVIIGCAWLVAGFLRGLVVAESSADLEGTMRLPLALEPKPGHAAVDGEVLEAVSRIRSAMALGGVELGIILGLLDALFLSFVIVQIRYFFGGAPLVEASSTLTYAEYARSGFFELVAVTALVLPLLLTLDWLRRPSAPAEIRIIRILTGIQLALLAIIVASALRRMRLYQEQYGMTELRLYTTAVMLWVAALLVWFCASVLAGRRDRFAFGAALASLVAVVALNALNPSALIVRVNADRARAGRAFDAAYAVSLGADAVPELVQVAPGLGSAERCTVSEYLLGNWKSEPQPWRTWSLARAQAHAAVQEHSTGLSPGSCSQSRQPHSFDTLAAIR